MEIYCSTVSYTRYIYTVYIIIVSQKHQQSYHHQTRKSVGQGPRGVSVILILIPNANPYQSSPAPSS